MIEVPPGCGKKRYRRRADALLELKRTRRKLQLGVGWRNENRAYHCPICYGWHLTSGERAYRGG